ncbi:MAG: xylulokinase [Rhodobacteraceae bacterium]|jgi:xylulokinase|uniref:Xylulose kinase n=1 Tax=Salipiger profundus TaxID=1229727 RepID=A0A1U7DB64_9RHOB|nr:MULTISPECIES: xylulokinase [Salipiger]APX25352.1 xylulokinase [Salipiger profundus]MAB05339.1 xylulokinase [Paracoccaceae bacterium]GGA24822.1 xylulokinase [Salipiger profundus]SFD85231.1 xylulokinase [Salipiger profundus]
MSFLGLDLGTSGLRALLTDEGGTPLASAERHYEASHPRSGWSEQDPADWIAALEGAVEELRAHPSWAGLRGIGVAGHMHGAVTLDADDRVIRPCILWNDTRSHAEAARLDTIPGVRALSGNIVFPGFTAPKLLWMQAHEPEAFARVARVLLPAAYLNLYLTGDHVADMSDSAGTSWLDTGARDWSDRLLEAGNMRRDQMPRLVEGCAPAGILREDLARQWGVGPGAAVAGGAGDNAAAACGTGVLSEGQGFVSLGTSGVLLAARDGYRPSPDTALHSFCHAVPGTWYQMGVMLSCTDSLNWLARITGARPAELTAALGDCLTAPGRVRFLPYLSGERTPHNDADIRGAFTGIGAETTREDLTRAVLEGVSFGLRDSAEALRSVGARPAQLLAIGGGSGSRYWLRLLATVLDTPLHLPKAGEFGAALGAARLGRIAATGESPAEVMTPPATGEVVEPVSALVPAFDTAYRRFGPAYRGIRAIQ